MRRRPGGVAGLRSCRVPPIGVAEDSTAPVLTIASAPTGRSVPVTCQPVGSAARGCKRARSACVLARAARDDGRHSVASFCALETRARRSHQQAGAVRRRRVRAIDPAIQDAAARDIRARYSDTVRGAFGVGSGWRGSAHHGHSVSSIWLPRALLQSTHSCKVMCLNGRPHHRSLRSVLARPTNSVPIPVLGTEWRWSRPAPVEGSRAARADRSPGRPRSARGRPCPAREP